VTNLAITFSQRNNVRLSNYLPTITYFLLLTLPILNFSSGLKQQLSKNRQLFTQYHSFCTQPWLYLWWKSYFLWSDLITFYSV